ncbi:hypothetical protein [Roseomonas indoligenes]|uniref:Uncharacterized protein n=1 Tax=Roseomonas indoligenes TaxID=2820811 RepID=A0A940MV69_9PROT|nr:hypothetical protein [Pararoseomonas indoligenes]MBP0494044.1 hypothetical protein [Pararoseomonas indoligenes]
MSEKQRAMRNAMPAMPAGRRGAMARRLNGARQFPLPSLAETAGSVETPALEGPEGKKATLVARIASRLMAGLLANPAPTTTPEGAVGSMVRLASRIEAEARRVVADPQAPPPPAPLQAPSAQATAWRSGYLDGEAGRPYSFRGPQELEPDYWDGMQAAQRTVPGAAARS